jgi:sn-glycerol 3-phosphate transport system permease protein
MPSRDHDEDVAEGTVGSDIPALADTPGGHAEIAVADQRARTRRRARRWRLFGRYLVLTFLSLIVLIPVYIAVVSSVLVSPGQLTTEPPALWPTELPFGWFERFTGGPPQWDSYETAWDRMNMATYLRNSFIVTAIIVTGQVATSILAGYAFAVLEFPLKRALFLTFLATMMVPFEVTIITNLTTVTDLGWYNTYAGLAVPFLATGFGAFLLRQAFLQIPHDLKDAAAVDGYGHLRFLFRVAVPLARPMIAALTVFSFLAAWNQYLWPLLVTADADLRTVQIGLQSLRDSTPTSFNVRFAGTLLAVLPLLVLLIVFQKQLIRGLTAGAVKG